MSDLKVKINDQYLIFTEGKDGWYEANGYTINPNKTECQTYPWYADHVCEVPKHEFTILEG